MEKAIASLINHLSDADFLVRSLTAEALEPLADLRALQGLKLLLNDPYSTVREKAVDALAQYHDKRLFRRFMSMYQTETNVELRKSCMHAIAFTGHRDSFPFLKETIRNSVDIVMRVEALEVSFMTKGRQAAIDLLLDQFDGKEVRLTRNY